MIPNNLIDRAGAGKWMTRRYLFALTVIALLAGSAFAIVALLIAEHKSVLAVVNVSGRQRMLSQRTALFVERLVHAETEAQRLIFRSQLQEATDLLENAHRALTGQGGPIALEHKMTEDAFRGYFDGPLPLNRLMLDYIASLRRTLDSPVGDLQRDSPEVRYVLSTAPGELVDRLDRMVALYQDEGEEAFYRMQLLEGLFLFLTLLTLTLEVMLIFRPMVRHITDQMDHIGKITEDLSRARDTLEDEVIRRTRELDDARVAAVQANKAKSRFLAAAGHDLKQPLEAIGMFSGMLERSMQDERSQSIMRDMHDAQRSMRSLLDSILQLSKLEAEVVEPRLCCFDLKALVSQMAGEFEPRAAQKGLQLRSVIPDLYVETDPLLLERIVRNFLTNALRYTRRGKILMGVRRRGAMALIQVWDTGPGIPDDSREKVFQEFSQLEDPDRDRSEGIGLGLAIVRRLANLLGHQLECQSWVGSGSVFSVSVPLAKKN
ncbi:ATP-binding protein [Magnetospira sp. QH-2]|uniref:ATP-binding protein n=1 Tax=Magnetospira sp. (strain QH-2) TaxID=1288970 RepID=UPI00208F54D7|nr:ATP-binding protein [Magnetospira sp. QH-2]